MPDAQQALFLRSIRSRSEISRLAADRGFPFDLPFLAGLDIEFGGAAALLVGENGSGKSTLLEAVAVATGCAAMGSEELSADPTLEPARQLARVLRLTRNTASPRARVFFRAEDAFGFTKRVIREQASLEQLEQEFTEQFPDGSWAQRLAVGTARGQRHAFVSSYGAEPDAKSHGESFLELLQRRLVPGGLYILDEPETPLSPVSVLALLRLLMQSIRSGSQFIIATHSPILMALPGAQILRLDSTGLEQCEWDEVEHVQITRSFLQRPEAFLRQLDVDAEEEDES